MKFENGQLAYNSDGVIVRVLQPFDDKRVVIEYTEDAYPYKEWHKDVCYESNLVAKIPEPKVTAPVEIHNSNKAKRWLLVLVLVVTAGMLVWAGQVIGYRMGMKAQQAENR